MQDCRDDFLELDRVYLPLDSFAAAGIDVSEVGRPMASPAMRSVLDRTLDGADDLLRRAADLPRHMKSRRLAAETAVILEMAVTLAARLRQSDPLATRVTLSRPRFALAALVGIGRLRWLWPGGSHHRSIGSGHPDERVRAGGGDGQGKAAIAPGALRRRRRM